MRLELENVGATTTPMVFCNLCDGATRSADVPGLRITLASLAPGIKDLALLGQNPQLGDYTATLTITPP